MPLPGFTLAELLIALAVLGIIATFTVPKVLQSQQDSQRKAVLKETIAALSNALYQGVLENSIKAPFSTYFSNKLNAVKICPMASNTEGCWDESLQGANAESTSPGIILHSGAQIVGLSVGSIKEYFYIEWNGTAGPNQTGKDRFYLSFCLDTLAACQADGFTRNNTLEPNSGSASTMANYAAIF